MFRQGHRVLNRASHRGRCRRRGDRVRKFGIRMLRREGEVTSPQLSVRNCARELEVEFPPLLCPRAFPRRRGEQRVRWPHTIPVEEQDARFDCVLDRDRIRERLDLGHARIGTQRNGEQQPPCGARQPRDVDAQQVLDGVRHGDVLAGLRQPALDKRTPELEREQRVPRR